ncbi:hypothetical protein EJB05_55667 [Eragrostis curvula]|uniref:Nucleoside diphosphate kinase n=1 Tax=Eragrostis curvula TaxID=38414 RepID=A0A5J9SJ82_9POAL|nr:hypothetical protein EJB05_55667 [Eragrostis curvula]
MLPMICCPSAVMEPRGPDLRPTASYTPVLISGGRMEGGEAPFSPSSTVRRRIRPLFFHCGCSLASSSFESKGDDEPPSSSRRRPRPQGPSSPPPPPQALVAAEGRTAVLAALTNLGRKTLPTAYSYHKAGGSHHASGWLPTIAAIPAAVYMLQDQEAHAAEMERTFIAIKPDGVQRGLLFAIKLIVPSKEFAEKHYHDLKERPFFMDCATSLALALYLPWFGKEKVLSNPSKSEPGTIRGDLAVVVGRNIIHGSDGPETAKDEIALWLSPRKLVSYTSNAEKWIYGVNKFVFFLSSPFP